MSATLPVLNYTIDLNDPIPGVKHVVAAFCPSLPTDHLDLKVNVLSGGYMNHMYKIFAATDEHGESVIVRINADIVGSLFDREEEFRLVFYMYQKGMYGKIYGKFQNGVVYEFIKGRTLTLADIQEPHIARLLAQKFAEFHAISRDFPGVKTPTHPRDFCLPILNRLPIKYKDPQATLLAYKLFPDVEELQEEFQYLLNHPSMQNIYADQPVVFCHHDLIPNNIIFDEKTDTVHIIDYEFAASGYQIEDIGTHFSEFIGMDVNTMDASLLPSQEFQLKWIRIYLETWNEFTADGRAISDTEVWNFYVNASRYSLLKNWFIICFVLASEEHNPDYIAQAKRLKWDSFEYAKKKLDIYLQYRDKILALELLPSL
ncbi:ethanolamine kinase 2-like [Paramacrobiotus metropolitanus]|uniref:ethanolamine kinase 2-like n=1 Tax=Paramacrobiotus metropolitanus TaxID=2943436 RepID=UPI002445CE71|nr:ethanolamine kinase 2-like [Paramacrobiotus metropolitanus]